MSLVERLKVYGYIAKYLLKKKEKRTEQVINSIYNDGIWNKNYDAKLFSSLHGMYNKPAEEVGIFIKNGKCFRSTYGDFFKPYWNQILSNLSDYKNSEIVELGCGLGYNLFELQRNGFTILHGYDISKNAVKLSRTHSKKTNSDIKFDVLDITKPLPNFSNKIIFTFTCLEQLKHQMKTVIQNIVDSTPKLVINFEIDYDSLPFILKRYIHAVDIQDNLMKELKTNPEVNLISSTLLPYTISPVNRLSCIKWKPAKVSTL